MDGKVFTSDTKQLLKGIIDDAVKLGVVGEILDGPMIGASLSLIDHFGDKVIPDEYDTPINSVATKIINKDYEGAKTEIATLVNKLVDIPMVDEVTEEAIFQTGFSFILKILLNYINKKQKEPVE